MKEDNFLIGQIEDKLLQCENQFCETHTGFLDTHQQSLVRAFCKKIKEPKCIFYGGYVEAERVIFLCLPEDEALENCNPLSLIRVNNPKGTSKLSHRDYLGSIMGMGIKREMIGDILVRDDGADIITIKEINGFLESNYKKAGKAHIDLEIKPINELIIPMNKGIIVKDTIASLRLDNIIASAFSLSRSSSCEAIKKGIVYVNNIEISKTDYQVLEGDKIVLRGKGKVNLIEIGGKSRKDRQYVTFEKF